MARKELTLPGEYVVRFTAVADALEDKGGALRGKVTYVGKLRKLDATWSLELQWVDIDKQGYIVKLPHEVVQAVIRAKESIVTKSRKAGAQKALVTRQGKGLIPFQKKAR